MNGAQVNGARHGAAANAAPLVFILLLAMAAAHAAARSWDLWWHLEAGEQIAASVSVPRVDDFSFTSRGARWTDHEWLFQLLMHGMWERWGAAGLALLKGVAAALAALAGYFALRARGGGSGLALMIVGLCVVGFRFRLTERPELATIALAPATALLLASLAARPAGAWRRLAALAALTILWVNMHAGALLAPLLAMMCLLVAAGERWRRAGESTTLLVSVQAALLTAAALLVNPYGHRIYAVPLEIASALAPRNLTNPEWAAPAPLEFPFLYVVVIACVALAAASLRPGIAGSMSHLGMFVLAAAMALMSVRHIGVFFAILPTVFPLEPLRRVDRRVPLIGGMALCLAAAGFMFFVPPGGAQSGYGIAQGRFPSMAADFIDAHLSDARLYNDVRFGGYLIRRGYPERRVFIDGRNEVHASLLADLSAALDDGRRWDALMDRHGVEGAVVGYRDAGVRLQDGSLSTFSETHFPKSRWSLVHWDDVAMIFVRRDGRFATVAAERESRARPEAFRLGLPKTELLSGGEEGELLKREISRKLADNPDCALAKSMASVYGIGESIQAPERGRQGRHAPASP